MPDALSSFLKQCNLRVVAVDLQNASGTVNGNTINKLASPYNDYSSADEGIAIVNIVGTGNHTIKLQDSDDGSSWADVTDTDKVEDASPIAAPGGAAVLTTLTFSPVGVRQYLRIVIAIDGAATDMFGLITFGELMREPVS